MTTGTTSSEKRRKRKKSAASADSKGAAMQQPVEQLTSHVSSVDELTYQRDSCNLHATKLYSTVEPAYKVHVLSKKN